MCFGSRLTSKASRGVHLHAIGQLERLDARFELGVVLAALLMALVELAQQIELAALLGQRQRRVLDVLDELLDLGVARVDVGALVGAGQEGGLPVLRLLNGVAARTHGDEAGQVLVVAAQAVGHPRTHARPNLPGFAAVHQQQRRLVIGHVGVHRANDADVVDAAGGVREQVAHLDTGLAVSLKLERRGEGGAGLAFGAEVGARQQFAGVFRQRRLGIERIDVRRAAVHKQVDDALGLAEKVRPLGCERRRGTAGIGRRTPALAKPSGSPGRARRSPCRNDTGNRGGCEADGSWCISSLCSIVFVADSFVSSPRRAFAPFGFIAVAENLPFRRRILSLNRPAPLV